MQSSGAAFHRRRTRAGSVYTRNIGILPIFAWRASARVREPGIHARQLGGAPQNRLALPSCGCEFSNLHFFDKIEILSPQGERSPGPTLLWQRVFQLAESCGCKLSHVGASFPTCTCLQQDEILSPQGDTMKSCLLGERGSTLSLTISPSRPANAKCPGSPPGAARHGLRRKGFGERRAPPA